MIVESDLNRRRVVVLVVGVAALVVRKRSRAERVTVVMECVSRRLMIPVEENDIEISASRPFVCLGPYRRSSGHEPAGIVPKSHATSAASKAKHSVVVPIP